jgi:hypothetical protein
MAAGEFPALVHVTLSAGMVCDELRLAVRAWPGTPVTWVCAVPVCWCRGRELGGLYDGGHGADQLLESLDWPGFAADVDAGL